jgi:predicted nucleic acid-binding protein
MPSRFVVDNSVVMAWCFRDESSPYADAVLERLDGGEAVVPAVWPLEVGNVLTMAARRGRLEPEEIPRILAMLAALPITVEQESPERMLTEILALARKRKLTTYDASYLDLAIRLGLPIATVDAALAKAARKCHVPLL